MIFQLEKLRSTDYSIVKDIYDYYIENTTATFHLDLISIEELKATVPLNHPKYQSFLIYSEGIVCGYCYIGSFKARAAYDRTAEITVYLKPESTGKGIAFGVVNALEEIAKSVGINVLIACITGENTASIRLFEKCGYEKCAHFKQVGEKFGRILDVVDYQKIIG
ncbi:N-acetyltransferase family protein [Flammeovirga pectinis]|uniref:N-acetyltransferase family protein n=1 Tax=Flammeovirga pectinis TaxID=2494373 RepID=A0A3S9P9P0_9BACT|nr:GNAT family N-acetyltransferase [Flammeovirga pectinis]AZQ64928.1 N-acetyltransferase family protein [Flammeovirga pectinis]